MKKISQQNLFEGKWLLVRETVYETKEGFRVRWESVHRTQSTVGVVVVARLMPSKRFILIKQFRPAVQGYVISFPAGLAFGDPAHALVELKEETGYTGQIVSVSPVLKSGASIVDDNGLIVVIDVDEHDPKNINPKQELEPAEDISVCLVSKQNAQEFLINEQASGSYIASNLWYFFVLSELF